MSTTAEEEKWDGNVASSHNNEVDDSYRSFFLADPVSDKEVAATCDSIYENLDRALLKLEALGVQGYKTYLQDLQSKTEANEVESRNDAYQELEDLTIRGSPRDYQTALLEIAKSRNTIIHLGTGMGKTLIALLCIQHFAALLSPLENDSVAAVPLKQALFLVPSVALAVQQSAALRANLPYTVATACWNVNTHSRQQLRQANILVATHGALHDLLMHYGDLFAFRNFNLVVFDECHYAIGNHQYKVIMDKWYHTLPQDQRPHILGLTASPLTNVKQTHSDHQLSQMLISLEQTLDCRLVTWNDTSNELSQIGAFQHQVIYEAGPEVLPHEFPSHDGLDIHKCRPRELSQLLLLYQDLGPLPVSIYLESVMQEISCNVYEKESAQQFHCLLNHLESLVKYCREQTESGGQGQLFGGRSDKLIRLENILMDQLQDRDDAVGLVFVQRRITAMALYNYFQRRDFVAKEKDRSVPDMSVDVELWSPTQNSNDQNSSHHSSKSSEGIIKLPSCEELLSQASVIVDDQFDDADQDIMSVQINVSKPHELVQLSNADDAENVSPPVFIVPNQLLSANVGEQLQPISTANLFADQFYDADETEGLLPPVSSICILTDQFCDADEAEGPMLPPSSICMLPDQFCDAVESGGAMLSLISCSNLPNQFCDADDPAQWPLIDYNDFSPNEFVHVREATHLAQPSGIYIVPPQSCYTNESEALVQTKLCVSVDQFRDADDIDTPLCVSADQCGNAVYDTGVHSALEQLCDKIEVDLSILHDYRVPDQLCNVVESDQRTARQHPIRCGVLVRRATQIFKYLNAVNHLVPRDNDSPIDFDPDKEWLHQEMQIKGTLNALRKKEINVLVATSIVEEGVDVQACSFVVAFDNASSVKAYIQMKGRARQKDAKFFLFSKDCWSPALQILQLSEQRIRSFVTKQRVEDKFWIPIPLLPSRHGQNPLISAEWRAIEVGEYRARHGTVDLKSAKSLLNRYIMTIPIESMARATKDSFLLHMPTYREDELILPAHLPLDVRVVTIPLKYRFLNRRARHEIMALMACVRLYKLTLLNERLLPLDKNDLTKELTRVSMNHPEGAEQFAEDRFPSFLATGSMDVFVYSIIQSGTTIAEFNRVINGDSKTIALICSERIPVNLECLTFHHRQLGEINCELGQEIAISLDEHERKTVVDFFAIVFGSRWRKKTWGQWFQARDTLHHQVLPPLAIDLFSAKGELDWKGMTLVIAEYNRSATARESACRGYGMLSVPRLCNPIYHDNSSYLVFGPSSLDCSASLLAPDEVGATTFQDHYKTAHDCEVSSNEPLYVAQRLWHQPCVYQQEGALRSATKSFMPEGVLDDMQLCPSLATVLLPQSLCREAIVADSSLALLSIVLPQLLYTLERQLRIDKFIRYCLVNFPVLGTCVEKLPWTTVSVALTARSANVDDDYDRLEWVGDGVLKLLQSDALLFSPNLRDWVKHLHEGDLTILRSAMGSNERLAAVCQRCGFEKFVLTLPLARGIWVPQLLEGHSADINHGRDNTYSKKLSMKARADVIESMLGLIYLHFGYSMAKSVGLECGVLLPYESGINLDQFIRPHMLPRANLYNAVGLLTGRSRFRCPSLVEEAFTHPSVIHEVIPSYQKLEWVGDAVLCIAIREWVFRTFPLLPVGDMVTLEAAVVSNEVLGYRCFMTGLHKLINHRDQTIPSRLEYYEWSITEGGRALWASDPPKMLPDVIEALFGAAHLDGGFEAGQLAVKTTMGPILESIESLGCDASKLAHPISKLNHMAGHLLGVNLQPEDTFIRKKGQGAMLWNGNGWRKGRIDGNGGTATVDLIGFDIISVVDPSLKSARNTACSLTVAVLERHPELVKRFNRITAAIDSENCKGNLVFNPSNIF